MLGELNEDQIEELLKTQSIGRIGCHSDGITYVVPVNYFYEDSFIYAHSGHGMKVNFMRKNPDVCFQVDNIQDMGNWQSVIAWGKFEELTDRSEKELALQKLINKIVPLLNNETSHPSHGITALETDIGDKVELILYRIDLDRKTGRFEKRL